MALPRESADGLRQYASATRISLPEAVLRSRLSPWLPLEAGLSMPRRWTGCGRRTPPSRRASRCGWRSGPPTCSGPGRRADRAGLDVSGLDGVIAVDPVARTAEVQGMCTYEHLVDATLPHGLIPLRRAAAAHDHARRRGDRARHRVDQLPQRAAARVGARDGRLHRRRRGGHDPAGRRTCSTRSPTPTARSATPPGCGSRSRRCPAASRCGTCASTTPACSPRRSPRSSRPASTTGSGSTASTASRSSPASTT